MPTDGFDAGRQYSAQVLHDCEIFLIAEINSKSFPRPAEDISFMSLSAGGWTNCLCSFFLQQRPCFPVPHFLYAISL